MLLAKAQDALREERDRAKRYLDTPDVILLALDMDGCITLINRYACAVLGRPAAELLGRNWIATCVPERMRDAVGRTLQGVFDSELTVGENPVLTNCGEERLIGWRNTALRDDDGRVIGTFSSGADITDRHHAAEALTAADERAQFVLKSAGVGTWDMDYATGLLQWSDTLEGQYGLPQGTFAGTFPAFVDRIHPEDRASVLKTMQAAMKNGTDFSLEHRVLLAGRHGTVADRRGAYLPRRTWRRGAWCRDFPGRHGAPHAGSAVPAGSEDGSGGTPGRRRRPRLQQSADRDPRLLRAVTGGRRSERAAPRGDCRNPEGRDQRRGAHPTAACLQPEADHRAEAARSECRDHRHAGDARAADREGRERCHLPGAAGSAGRRRSRADRAGRDESRRERAGRDAGGWGH